MNAISREIACQNAAYLAAICDLELRFRATTGGRGAILESAWLKRCEFACAFGRPLSQGFLGHESVGHEALSCA